MANPDPAPTNERIVAMLADVQRRLDAAEARERELAANLQQVLAAVR
jgi:hypothetical protein